MSNEVRVHHTLFESLVRCVRPDAALRAALREAGFDPDVTHRDYPASVWLACEDVVRRHGFADLARAAAFRALGQQLVRNFFETLVGRVVGGGLRMVGPERAMRRAALSFGSVLEPVDIHAEPLGPQHWLLCFRRYPFTPETAAAVCEEALRYAGAAHPQALVEHPDASGFDLRIRW